MFFNVLTMNPVMLLRLAAVAAATIAIAAHQRKQKSESDD